MIKIRTARKADMAALYQITLATGQYGADASLVYQDPDLLGHIFAAPYLAHEPKSCFVAEDTHGVVGFVVGTPDTRRFETCLETDWWPDLRLRYPMSNYSMSNTQTREKLQADQRLCHMIHHPEIASDDLVHAFPAHMHLNLLPRAQGQGVGRGLFAIWCDSMRIEGVLAVHVGVSLQNPRALGFWRKMGFHTIDQPISDSNWYGGYSLS